jgi:hypothetical protein
MCADARVAIRQVAEMHLDERLEKSREVLGKQLAAGQQKVSSAYNRLWAEMEAMREAQRKRAEEARLQAEKEGRPIDDGKKCKSDTSFLPKWTTLTAKQGKHLKHLICPTQKQALARISLAGAPGRAKREKDGAQRHPYLHPHQEISRERKTSREINMGLLVTHRRVRHHRMLREEACFLMRRRTRRVLERTEGCTMTTKYIDVWYTRN